MSHKNAELCSTLSIGKTGEELRYSKVCAHWVSGMLIQTQKETREAITTDLLHQYDTEGEGFLSQIVMGDETWIHYF
jgi:hypothetical protein